MKAKIKATGEIIQIASYAKIALDQCDSCGNPIELKPEEVELINDVTEDEHWQDVRERATIAAMQTLIKEIYDPENNYLFSNLVAKCAVEYADALIIEFKKKNSSNNEE